MNATARTFEVRPAVREAVGLLISLVGPSSSGKTFSALRVATGIQRVVGGDIDVIDTNNGRALYYADQFKFNHLRFAAPFGPLDYLDAIRHCARRGAKTIVTDSMSDEHDGVGGVLEIHEAETRRLSGGDPDKAERIKMLAWAKPKSERKKLINEMLQLNVNLVFTFRAKEKIKIVKGKPPADLGWQPIAGEDFIYEMVLQCLLKPGASGVPTWQSPLESERMMMKLPEQFKDLFGAPKQLDEDLGARLAEWANGGVKLTPEVAALLTDYAACVDAQTLEALEKRRTVQWGKQLPAGEKPRLKQASDAARKRLDELKAGAGKPGEQPDNATWMTTLRAQTTSAAIDESWTACGTAYGGMVPLEVEDAYQVTREAIVEREAKQDEM
jgi:hypothetical protein